MANIDKIQVGDTTYNIAASGDATNIFTSGDVADGSATAWTTVAALASGETTSSILSKVSNMFKNIRYLYKQLGTTDISGIGTSVTAAISALNTNKAASDHTHSLATTAAPGLAPTLSGDNTQYLNGEGSYTVPTDTTYAFSNGAPTLAWSTTSTVGTVGGTALTVTMPANPDTNTTYAFSNGNPTLAWGTKSTVGTAGGVAFTVTMPANPNTNTTYGTNVGCYGSLSGTTLTLNTRNFRV